MYRIVCLSASSIVSSTQCQRLKHVETAILGHYLMGQTWAA